MLTTRLTQSEAEACPLHGLVVLYDNAAVELRCGVYPDGNLRVRVVRADEATYLLAGFHGEPRCAGRVIEPYSSERPGIDLTADLRPEVDGQVWVECFGWNLPGALRRSGAIPVRVVRTGMGFRELWDIRPGDLGPEGLAGWRRSREWRVISWCCGDAAANDVCAWANARWDGADRLREIVVSLRLLDETGDSARVLVWESIRAVEPGFRSTPESWVLRTWPE